MTPGGAGEGGEWRQPAPSVGGKTRPSLAPVICHAACRSADAYQGVGAGLRATCDAAAPGAVPSYRHGAFGDWR